MKLVYLPRLRVVAAVQLLLAALSAHAAGAHMTSPQGSPSSEAAPAASERAKILATLKLRPDPTPVSARFSVKVIAAGAAKSTPPRQQDWYFSRDATQVALLKGNIDETWHRDARGQLSFERVFHEEQRAVDYSTGELNTLNVQADWAALSSFIDPHQLAGLKLRSRSGLGANERLRLSGVADGESLSVDWLPALQLPARVVRVSRAHGTTRIELKQHAEVAPNDWPKPGLQSAGYLRMDAADFGDMDYEPVVKKSEALDVRLGWRAAHKHD